MNLNEGSARHTSKDRHRFYHIALGSFREAEIILEIAEIKDPQIENARKQLAGSLVNLCKQRPSRLPQPLPLNLCHYALC